VWACRWNEEEEASWSVGVQVCLSEELVCSSAEGEENLKMGKVCHWSEAEQAC
jgi:hypothetical protein